jgi:hypothetical protein
LRKKIKGWSINTEAEMKRTKKNLINEVDVLDKLAEHQALSP